MTNNYAAIFYNMCVSVNFIPCGRRAFKANLKGRFHPNRRRDFALIITSRLPEENVILMERCPGFRGLGWGRRRSGGLPCAPGRSPRAAAGSAGSRVAGRASPCYVKLVAGHLETCGWHALCVCAGLLYTTASPGIQ